MHFLWLGKFINLLIKNHINKAYNNKTLSSKIILLNYKGTIKFLSEILIAPLNFRYFNIPLPYIYISCPSANPRITIINIAY